MKLKLDENLGRSVVELFRQAGHDTTTVPSEGLCSAPDRAVAEACRQDARALVTLDLDFGNPLLFKPSEHHGFAILRVPGKGSLKYVSDLARTLIRGLAEREIRGKLWIVEAGKNSRARRGLKAMTKTPWKPWHEVVDLLDELKTGE